MSDITKENAYAQASDVIGDLLREIMAEFTLNRAEAKEIIVTVADLEL